MRNTVYFSVSTGWALRNFVSTGVVSALAAENRVVLVHPTRFADFLASHCRSRGVELVRYDAGTEPFSWKLLRQARKKVYLDFRESATERIWQDYGRRPVHKIVGAAVITLLVKIFGYKNLSSSLEFFDYFFNRRSSARWIFRNCQRGDVYIATHASTFHDESLHRAAIDAGCRTALLVLSWDHLSSKIVLGTNFDKLLVWNSVSKSEISRTLPSYGEGSVSVVGAPQFDVYSEKPRLSYSEWCARVGLDPQRGFILFSTMPQVRHDGQHVILRALANALRENPARYSQLQILVKPHPFDVRAIYENLEVEGLIRLLPGDADGSRAPEEWIPSNDSAAETRDALYYCAMNINIFSTMTLEACYFDKPIIHIAFDCPGQTNPIPCRKYYDFDHFRPIVELECSVLAEDMRSLLDAVAEAAIDSTLRQVGRRRVADRYFGVVPGRSAATVVAEISRLVEAG